MIQKKLFEAALVKFLNRVTMDRIILLHKIYHLLNSIYEKFVTKLTENGKLFLKMVF